MLLLYQTQLLYGSYCHLFHPKWLLLAIYQPHQPQPLSAENGPLSEQLKKSEPVVTVRLAELRRPAVAQELSSPISTPFICSFFTSLPLPVDQRSVGAQLNSTQSTVGELLESLLSLLFFPHIIG